MSYEEKPSLDDTLTHFGVKGMKWGKLSKRKRTAVGVAAVALTGPIGLAGVAAYQIAVRNPQQSREIGAKAVADIKNSGLLDRPMAELRKK